MRPRRFRVGDLALVVVSPVFPELMGTVVEIVRHAPPNSTEDYEVTSDTVRALLQRYPRLKGLLKDRQLMPLSSPPAPASDLHDEPEWLEGCR